MRTTSGLKVDLTDSAVTSLGQTAIEASSGAEITLANTKVTGANAGLTTEGNIKLKATKKSAISSPSGIGIATTSNSEVNLTDASLEGAVRAFKGSVNDKLMLGQGARVAGKKGGIEVEGNAVIDGTGATIEGGAGPAIFLNAYNGKITLRQGLLRGTPAIEAKNKPTLTLEGMRVEGEQKIGR